MIDKLQPREIFSLNDQSNNSTPGHQRIIAMYKPITIIHENSNGICFLLNYLTKTGKHDKTSPSEAERLTPASRQNSPNIL